MNDTFKYYFFLVVTIIAFFPTKKAFAMPEKPYIYLKKSEEAYHQNNFKKATIEAGKALDSLPNEPANKTARLIIINEFSKSSIAYSKLLASQGQWEQAKNKLQDVLNPNIDPNNSEALHLLAHFDSSNSNDSKINSSSLYVNKKNESIISHEETRDHLLLDVEKNWEYPVTTSITSQPLDTEEKEQELLETGTLIAKLHSLIIPIINLEDVSIAEAIDYFKEKSCEADPLKKGINIFCRLPDTIPLSSISTNPPSITSSEFSKPERHLTLELHETPLYVALEYLAKQAGLQMRVDPYAVSLLPPLTPTEQLFTQEYEIPPNFIPMKENEVASSSTQEPLSSTASRLPHHFSAQDYLQSQGIEFKIGASATYLPSSNKLLVRNTQENMELITTLVKAARKTPFLQIAIETKFIEINQNDLTELGFNWLLGPFQIGNSGLEGSGGGTTTDLNTTAYPFPTTGMNPVGALRSGNEAITDTSIDSVIGSTPSSTTTARSAPGIFSIGGIYSNPQFQMVLRALHQKKGVDLMAAPHVTTRNGKKAVIKIVDEFIYPSQYSAPQLPLSTTNSSGRGPHQAPPTITPAFPNSWITKNLGVILEAKPTIALDGKTIELEIHPQITDFDGFINYGTPINTVGYNFSATNMSTVPFSETLTTNTINQPVFTVREVNTSVMVTDGQTVVIGGLIREDIQHVEDKVPFLGDIPLAGRLFRSKADRKSKKNLIIFVTPHILNADGVPQHRT